MVSVPIMFVNALNNIAALVLVSGADFLSVFEKPQLLPIVFWLLIWGAKTRPTGAPAA